ncbi:MAG: M28 family peptidase [Longimicrobiaceae bacterium]
MPKLYQGALAALIVLSGAGCGGEVGGEEPSPRARSAELADRPAFNGELAFELLRTQVQFGPRVPGREGHRRQLEWMVSLLEELADTVIVQPFSARLTTGDTLALTNLFARFRPELDDRVLLLAHWDTRPRADHDPDRGSRERPLAGANDGASGTAVLLALAGLFAERPPPVGVDLLFTDGEDYGPSLDDMLLGARHFAANLPDGYPPLYGVLLDMVGDRDPYFPVEGFSAEYAPEVVERVWGVAADLGYGSYFPTSRGPRISDDHVPLNRAGVRTVNVIDFEYGPGNRYWHTHADNLDNVGPRGLEVVGEVIAELIYRGG